MVAGIEKAAGTQSLQPVRTAYRRHPLSCLIEIAGTEPGAIIPKRRVHAGKPLLSAPSLARLLPVGPILIHRGHDFFVFRIVPAKCG